MTNKSRVVVEQLLAVLNEAVSGPQQASTYFIDNHPAGGLLGTLQQVSAADASRLIAGTSIAAHVNHVVFGMKASTGWIHGVRMAQNWEKSWDTNEVDEAAWTQMQQDLQRRGEELCAAIRLHAAGSVEAMRGAVGAVAHIAYHLGAIRQKLAAIRASELPSVQHLSASSD